MLKALFDKYSEKKDHVGSLNLPPPPNKVAEGLDSASFNKLCRESKLISATFRTQDVDVVFMKHSQQRKLSYRGLQNAVVEIAAKKGITTEALADRIMYALSRTPDKGRGVTVPLSTRLHDDKDTYTGVHSKGGPTNVDREKLSMEQLTDRFKKADMRGIPHHVVKGPGLLQSKSIGVQGGNSNFYGDSEFDYGDFDYDRQGAEGGGGGGGASSDDGRRQKQQQHTLQQPIRLTEEQYEQLKQVYEAYTQASLSTVEIGFVPPPNPVAEGMDGARFLKLMKDARLLSKLFHLHDVDVVFSKHKIAGQRRMDFKGFKSSLREIATKKDINFASLVERLGYLNPSIKGTVAIATRLHDDKETYTGVHLKGGPTNVDREKLSMEQLTDRKKYDLRGIPNHVVSGPGLWNMKSSSNDQTFDDNGHSMDYEDDGNGGAFPPMPPDEARGERGGGIVYGSLQEQLSGVFYLYSGGERSMGLDSARFLKIAVDAQLFGDKQFRQQDVDLVFSKHKETGTRKLNIEGFFDALKVIATKKGISFEALGEQIAARCNSGPTFNGTQADNNRFFDDPSTWTGTHKMGGPVSSSRNQVRMSMLTDRSKKANVRGVVEDFYEDGEGEGFLFDNPGTLAAAATAAILAARAPDMALSKQGMAQIKLLFAVYAAHGTTSATSSQAPGISSSALLKFCNDGELFDSDFRVSDIDIIFTRRAVNKRLTLDAFRYALVDIANKKLCTMMALVDTLVGLCSSGPSKSKTTEALYNRFHDEKSTYTGTHKHGGPTLRDSNHVRASVLMDRSQQANVRGTLDANGDTRNIFDNEEEESLADFSFSSVDVEQLRLFFDVYAKLSKGISIPGSSSSSSQFNGIDTQRWVKFVHDARLVDQHRLSLDDVDTIFLTYTDGEKSRKLSFESFKEAFSEIAMRKNVGVKNLLALVATKSSVPSASLPNRFHDDRSTFTGAHKLGGPSI